MTHSLHRRGNRESLEGDYIVFASGSGRVQERAKHNKYAEILLKHNPVGLSTSTIVDGVRTRLRYQRGWDKSKDSGIFVSATLKEIKSQKDLSAGSGIYTDIKDVKAVLKELTEADLGFSVVVSGIFDNVHEACKEAGSGPHTINMSAGIFGRTDLLPEPKILEITTMCGHHMVSAYLVNHLLNQAKRGKKSAKNAAVEMAKQCTCNFFNIDRAEKLINEYISQS